MRVEHFIIGAAMFSLFILVGFNLFADQVVKYDIPADAESTFSQEFRDNVTKKVTDITQELEQTTQQSGPSDEDTEASLYKRGFSAMLKVFSGLGVAVNTFQLAAKEIGFIPGFIIENLVGILITLAAVFGVYMIWRFKPQNN